MVMSSWQLIIVTTCLFVQYWAVHTCFHNYPLNSWSLCCYKCTRKWLGSESESCFFFKIISLPSVLFWISFCPRYHCVSGAEGTGLTCRLCLQGLQTILDKLRVQHHYCLYCGCKVSFILDTSQLSAEGRTFIPYSPSCNNIASFEDQSRIRVLLYRSLVLPVHFYTLLLHYNQIDTATLIFYSIYFYFLNYKCI